MALPLDPDQLFFSISSKDNGTYICCMFSISVCIRIFYFYEHRNSFLSVTGIQLSVPGTREKYDGKSRICPLSDGF